ncbi:type II toxin-antitoxin system HicA family toxin [Candidatus Aerophobetes bacterium]|nr:type II toxin-antitoxin system HicA family toxin [Candidatus Aerophobetes bacterium]
MRMPRDLSAQELTELLKIYGYQITRQTGSHLRLTIIRKGEHHITIPKHKPLKVGTLSSILSDIASYLKVSRKTLIRELFGKE